MAIATTPKSARAQMVAFVKKGVDAGFTEVQIKEQAVEEFSDDPLMVSGALEFLAAWALSDTQSVGRRRAVLRALSADTSVFDALEDYLQPLDGRFLSILDMTKTDILVYVKDRRAAIEGEIQHIKCVEEIAQLLPSSNSTPRSFFKSKKQQADLLGIINNYYGG